MTRALLLDRFGWVDGRADLWPVFRDATAFAEVVKALAEPFRDADVTAVCGIESRDSCSAVPSRWNWASASPRSGRRPGCSPARS